MTEAAYDSIAEWYDRSIREKALLSADDAVTAALWETVGDVAGRLAPPVLVAQCRNVGHK